MSWHYVAVRERTPEEPRFTVREFYHEYGYTADAIEPDGETLDGLITTLERMLADVKRYPVIDDETGKEVAE